jgi:hypothetical protein
MFSFFYTSETFEISGNFLSGSVPETMFASTTLGKYEMTLCFHLEPTAWLTKIKEKIDISLNEFESSKIPTEIGLMTNLLHLDLSGISLTGPIPSEISNLGLLGTF